ncbi:hypothetical protein Holit_00021 [Hollandina sp. SP2]
MKGYRKAHLAHKDLSRMNYLVLDLVTAARENPVHFLSLHYYSFLSLHSLQSLAIQFATQSPHREHCLQSPYLTFSSKIIFPQFSQATSAIVYSSGLTREAFSKCQILKSNFRYGYKGKTSPLAGFSDSFSNLTGF